MRHLGKAVLVLIVLGAAYGVMAQQEPKAPPVEELRLAPPKAPAHVQRDLNTASALAKDLHEVVVFLEQGKVYFKEYQTGNHTPEENAQFLKFLEVHEKEQAIAKKEAEALKRWVFEKSGLED